MVALLTSNRSACDFLCRAALPGYAPVALLCMFRGVVICRCTIGLNVGLMVLFLSLAITFFLLAAGVTHHRANKVCVWQGCYAASLF